MQKILILTDSYLLCGDLAYFLSNELGHDYDYWYNKFLDNNEEIRTDEKIQKLIISKNYMIKEKEEDENLNIVGYSDKDIHLKIIEIPDGIKWHVRDYDCAVGEYICENHRTWN